MNVVRRMFIILFVLSVLLVGCSPKSSEMIVLEVGPKKVTLGEYEKFYTRNTGGWEVAKKSTQEERERFLDLLANYKLKLQDAYDRNLINDSDIVKELHEYRASLATAFMTDKEITDPGIKQLYDRRKEEIRAQHILLKIAPDASAEDTLKAYNKAMDIIHRAKSGENFDSLAIRYSEDPSVKMNSGDIYYFTSGQMVTEFENASYSMKKGEISSTPTRSAFGYHIIKINDRRSVRGSIKVSHIMARFQTSAADSADTLSALNRIKGIKDSLKKGWDFHKLAVRLSEDGGSAQQGGDLGWFERRRFVQPFDEAAFNLKVGEISGIVRTPFGYHLISCDSVKPFLPFADPQMHDELKKTYQQHKYNEDYTSYISRLKNDFHYSFVEKTFNEFVASLDSTKTTDDSAWAQTVTQQIRTQPIILLDARTISLDTVIILLNTKQEYRATPLRAGELKSRMDRVADAFLLEAKSAGLEQKYPEFAALMQEFTEGIMLYKAEQMEVWNKTVVSDSVLRDYYHQNSSKFMFPERVNISVISVDTDTLAYMVYDSLKRGADFADFAERYPEQPRAHAKNSTRGLQNVELDTLTRKAKTLSIGEISEPIEMDGSGFAIIKLNSKELARQKTFEEAGAEVSNAYQENNSKLLEKQWLERVKLRYPLMQHKDVLYHAFTSPPPDK